MRYVAAMGVVLLNVTVASAQTVPWTPLPNTLMSTVYPSPLPQGNNGPSSIIGAWNSAAFDLLRNQLIIAAAGGHGDYAGNEVYAFQHNAVPPSWARLTSPTPCLTLPSAWNYPSGDFSCDGTSIVSRHTYGGIAYNPMLDHVWMSGGSRWHDSGPTSMTWNFLPATNAWQQVGVTMSGYFLGMSLSFQSVGNPWVVWDPNGVLITINRWVYSAINEATNTTIPLACSGVSQGPNGAYSAAIDPLTRTLYVLGGGHLRTLDLSVTHLPIPAGCNNGPLAQDTIVATTGATEIETLNINSAQVDGFAGTGLAWDAIGGVLVAYGMTADKTAGRVYTLDPTTRIWTAWEAVGSPPPVPTKTGVWNKLWFANDTCLYVVTDGTKPVYQACDPLPWRTSATTYPVTISASGGGFGQVSGGGLYPAGAPVTVVATPDPGSTFSGWGGDPICPTFPMPARAVSCTAAFNIGPLSVTTATAGTGVGCVTGGGSYPVGTTVTLTATASPGSIFTGWTGAGCSASFTMPTTSLVCTANFVQDAAVCGP